jgi:hypothetical protein
VQPLPFRQKLVTAFLMRRVRAGRAHGANLGALLLGKGAYALTAALRVYFVYGAAFLDGFVGALWFAGPAADAVVANLVSHFLLL